MPENKKLTAWSWSRLYDYRLCPLRVKFKHIDRIKEPGSPAMDRGSLIHTMAENYIKGLTAPSIPPELKKFEQLFKNLRAQYKRKPSPILVEGKMGATEDWRQARWNDWKFCWVRAMVDCIRFSKRGTVATMYDWKTGKYKEDQREDYEQQLELYSLLVMINFPKVQVVFPELKYLDLGFTYPTDDDSIIEYTREEHFFDLQRVWSDRVEIMMSDTMFVATPNWKCRWCYFSSGAPNGQQLCEF